MGTEWRIKAVHLGNCNCAYGCPCKFSALPTHGNCRSVVAYKIEEGYFGAIRLDGLRAALITSWPGAIHEGNGGNLRRRQIARPFQAGVCVVDARNGWRHLAFHLT